MQAGRIDTTAQRAPEAERQRDATPAGPVSEQTVDGARRAGGRVATAGAAPPPPPILTEVFDGLQRTVGNRAVQRLVADRTRTRAKSGPGATNAIARVLDPSQVSAWNDAKGDEIIREIQGVIGEWQTFRASPATFDTTNSFKTPRRLITLLEEHPEFRNHVAQELRAGITYLQEMAGLVMPYRLLLDLVPGLTWKDPKHTYKMTAAGSASINGVGYLPVQEWDIVYTNAYGWTWTHSIRTAGIQWSISIARQSGVAGPNIGDIAGGKDGVKKKLTPGKSTSHTGEKGSNPVMPEFAEFNIREACVANPVKYWGFDDIGGVAAITNGPSVSAKLSLAGSAQATTGGMMKIGGSNGTIDFTEFTAGVTTSGVSNAKDAINMEFKAVLASVGVAAAWGTGQVRDMKAPKVEPKAREQTRTWGYVLEGFPVGDTARDVPDGLMRSMKLDGEQMRKLYEADLDALRQLGMNPEKFRLRFLVEGFASRVWAGAGNDAARQEQNRKLSAGRAWFMMNVIQSAFGTDHFYEEPVGRGAAMFARQAEGGPNRSDVVPEGDKDALDRMVEQYKQRQLALDPKIAPDELEKRCADYRRSVEKSNPKDGWGPAAQRVNITMSWKGYLIDYGMAGDAPAPSPAK